MVHQEILLPAGQVADYSIPDSLRPYPARRHSDDDGAGPSTSRIAPHQSRQPGREFIRELAVPGTTQQEPRSAPSPDISSLNVKATPAAERDDKDK